MFSRLLQEENAQFPIFVTLSGIVMLTRFLQAQKAKLPILNTPSSIITFTISLPGEHHGTASSGYQLHMFPFPLIVRVPSSSKVQVRLVPQVPPDAAETLNTLKANSMAQSKVKTIRIFFITFSFFLQIPRF